jgi:hypothetical protein
MTEIITDYLDAKQLADRLTALELHSTSELARLEKERDDARDDAAHWKIEYEIVVSRLCGVKHDRDNGVIFEHEIIPKLQRERDDAREKVEQQRKEIVRLNGATNHAGGTPLKFALRERDEAISQIAQAECRAERFCQERDEARDAIVGWENKWKCAVDMAARAELERDEALKCAKEYYVEFIRNASSDNKVSKPKPLNPFYKY